MRRLIVITLLLATCAGAAMAQTGQFPGVAPSVPSPGNTQLGGAPLPMQVQPGPVVSPGYRGTSQVYTTRRGRTVHVPAGPPNQQSFGDRAQRCIEAGTAAGVGPNHIGSFTRRCAN